jgi:dTDP-4-dehydrorhamnose 3,5-epimerase
MKSQIDGVLIVSVITIPDERGMVMKVPPAPFVVNDTYVTTVRQGAIKAWHGYHTKHITWTVLSGLVKLVLVDHRSLSDTCGVIDEIYLGDNSMFTVLVPPGVYNGFKGVSQNDAHILVQADEPYGQIYRLPYDHFDYDWGIHNG